MTEEELTAQLIGQLAKAVLDLWANIGPREAKQLQPETIVMCDYTHRILDHNE